MTDEQKQPTDAANQAPEMDFDDEGPAENESEKPEAKQLDDQKHLTPEGEDAEQKKAIDQDAVNKRINKLTFEKYEERRKREEIETKLKALEQKQQQGDTETVSIPEMPDVFDPQYDQKMADRENALKKAAQLEAKRDYEARIAEKQQQERLNESNQQAQKWVSEMYDQASKLGIEKGDLEKADQTVATFIKDQGLARFIISQKSAPLIINHLAGNITELEHISKLHPIDAAAYIASKVIPDAEKYKPKVTATPDPLDIPDGKAAGKIESEYLKGVIFE